MLIAANPGHDASALGRALDIQRANMVPLLKRLEDAGLIAREAIDGKCQGLTLPPPAARGWRCARKVIEAFEREMLCARARRAPRRICCPPSTRIWR